MSLRRGSKKVTEPPEVDGERKANFRKVWKRSVDIAVSSGLHSVGAQSMGFVEEAWGQN